MADSVVPLSISLALGALGTVFSAVQLQPGKRTQSLQSHKSSPGALQRRTAPCLPRRPCRTGRQPHQLLLRQPLGLASSGQLGKAAEASAAEQAAGDEVTVVVTATWSTSNFKDGTGVSDNLKVADYSDHMLQQEHAVEKQATEQSSAGGYNLPAEPEELQTAQVGSPADSFTDRRAEVTTQQHVEGMAYVAAPPADSSAPSVLGQHGHSAAEELDCGSANCAPGAHDTSMSNTDDAGREVQAQEEGVPPVLELPTGGSGVALHAAHSRQPGPEGLDGDLQDSGTHVPCSSVPIASTECVAQQHDQEVLPLHSVAACAGTSDHTKQWGPAQSNESIDADGRLLDSRPHTPPESPATPLTPRSPRPDAAGHHASLPQHQASALVPTFPPADPQPAPLPMPPQPAEGAVRPQAAATAVSPTASQRRPGVPPGSPAPGAALQQVRHEPPLWRHLAEAGSREDVALLQRLTGAQAAPGCGRMLLYPHALGYLTCTGAAAEDLMRLWLLEGWDLEDAVESVQRDIAVHGRYRIHFSSAGVLTTTAWGPAPPPRESGSGGGNGTPKDGASSPAVLAAARRCKITAAAVAAAASAPKRRYGVEDFSWAQSVWSFFQA